MERIKIVQGDAVDSVIILEGNGVDTVTEINFVCEDLGVSYPLENTTLDGGWLLSIPKEDTANFRVGVFLYNLIATFAGGWKEAIIYGYECEVLYKK